MPTNFILFSKKYILLYKPASLAALEGTCFDHILGKIKSLETLFLKVSRLFVFFYSHSMVAGGFVVISYTTLFTLGTSFTILLDAFAKTS